MGVETGIVEITGGRQQHCQPHTVGVTFGNKHLQKDSLSIELNVTPERASLSESAHRHVAVDIVGICRPQRRSREKPLADDGRFVRRRHVVPRVADKGLSWNSKKRDGGRRRGIDMSVTTHRRLVSLRLLPCAQMDHRHKAIGGAKEARRRCVDLPEGAPAGAGGQPGSRPRTSRGVTHLS